MRYANVNDGVVTEISRVDPFAIFSNEYASKFIECADEVEVGFVSDGANFTPPPILPVDLGALKIALAAAIDDRVAAVTEKWTRFKEGYAKREAAAREYKLAGYTGDPTRWITSFATNANKTNQQATDIIIAQADGLNLALEDLEDLRMQKYQILRANDEAVMRSEHQRIMSEIDFIVGGLT